MWKPITFQIVLYWTATYEGIGGPPPKQWPHDGKALGREGVAPC